MVLQLMVPVPGVDFCMLMVLIFGIWQTEIPILQKITYENE